MTNTGDFRRFSFNYDRDVISAVEGFNRTRQSTAPKVQPKPRREVKTVKEGKRKSKAQLVYEQRHATILVAKICIVSFLAFSMLFAMLYVNAQKNELTHQVASLQTDLALAESENTRISSEIDSLVSMSMIDEYAVEQLGMTKVRSNQIRYIDVSQYKEERIAAAQMLLNSNE